MPNIVVLFVQIFERKSWFLDDIHKVGVTNICTTSPRGASEGLQMRFWLEMWSKYLVRRCLGTEMFLDRTTEIGPFLPPLLPDALYTYVPHTRPLPPSRFRGRRQRLKTRHGLLPESEGKNLAFTVLYVPYLHLLNLDGSLINSGWFRTVNWGAHTAPLWQRTVWEVELNTISPGLNKLEARSILGGSGRSSGALSVPLRHRNVWKPSLFLVSPFSNLVRNPN